MQSVFFDNKFKEIKKLLLYLWIILKQYVIIVQKGAISICLKKKSDKRN